MNIKKQLFKIVRSVLFLFLVLNTYNSFSQKRPPQDVRRVTVTVRYILKDGKNTGQSKAVYQEIYDSLGRLHTEIEYDFKDNYPHFYRWHTFKGRQIARTEYFENEKLQKVRYFTYNRDSLVIQEIIKKVKPGDTSLYLTLNYKYNQLKKPIQIEAKTATGKTAYKTKSTFDSKGTELSRAVSYKNGFIPLDSIIKLTNKPQYDSIGRLISNIETCQKINTPLLIKKYKYTYDKRNNIIGITIFDRNDKQISREERIMHDTKNRISQLKIFDSNDKISAWYGKRYEIYRNKNRRIYEIDY